MFKAWSKFIIEISGGGEGSGEDRRGLKMEISKWSAYKRHTFTLTPPSKSFTSLNSQRSDASWTLFGKHMYSPEFICTLCHFWGFHLESHFFRVLVSRIIEIQPNMCVSVSIHVCVQLNSSISLHPKQNHHKWGRAENADLFQ